MSTEITKLSCAVSCVHRSSLSLIGLKIQLRKTSISRRFLFKQKVSIHSDYKTKLCCIQDVQVPRPFGIRTYGNLALLDSWAVDEQGNCTLRSHLLDE